MKWKEMTGQERYQVVEMARKGEKSLKEICQTFGVSRQALSKAMEKASQAAMDALEPKKTGRKPQSEQEKEMKEGFALGEVIQSYREIKMGDYLMPHKQRSPRIPLSASPYGIWGRIIASEETRELIGPGHIVFLDRGRSDGIQEGQMYRVMYQEKGKVDPKEIDEQVLQEVFFGDLIVLLVEDQTATAVVVRSNDNIKAGTTFRSPK